jgi:hypothetical protein
LPLHPDNPVTEAGVLSGFSRHGVSSRFGRKRADLAHLWIDPIIVGVPWMLAGGLVFAALKALDRRRRA